MGPGGLLADLTKQVLETGLEVEMEEHVGYGPQSQGHPVTRPSLQRVEPLVPIDENLRVV